VRGHRTTTDAACILPEASKNMRTVFDCSLRSLRIALGFRLLRRRSQTKKRVGSLLLSTAERDPVFNCSLRSLRFNTP
jgi:hypothetical protein